MMESKSLFANKKFVYLHIAYPCALFILWFIYRMKGCTMFGIEYLCGQSLEVFLPIFGLIVYLFFLLIVALILRAYDSLRPQTPGRFNKRAKRVVEVGFYLILLRFFIMEYRNHYQLVMILVFILVIATSLLIFRLKNANDIP